MNQRKPNYTIKYVGLLVLICLTLLVSATGTTYARYRAERERKLNYLVREPEQIYLGTMQPLPEEGGSAEEKFVFRVSDQFVWETKQGITQLELVISNGLSNSEYSNRNQMVQLRMIGSLGIWLGSDTPKLYLVLPPEEDGEENCIVNGTVTPIAEGTALHQTYGDGWIYTFADEDGQELFWELDGGELSYVSVLIGIDGETPEDLSLLQPYVIAEVIDK